MLIFIKFKNEYWIEKTWNEKRRKVRVQDQQYIDNIKKLNLNYSKLLINNLYVSVINIL